MKLPIKYKLHNDRLWVRWGLDEIWKIVRITKAKRVTPITQAFGKDFVWTSKMKSGGKRMIQWEGKWFYKEVIGVDGHNGIDFEAPSGTRLYAPHDGKITKLTNGDGKGITLSGKEYKSRFYHLQDFICELNQKVKQGDLIALTDNTGRYTTAPHLHWGVKGLDGKYFNHRGLIEDLDVQKLPYKEGQCLIRTEANGEFYVIENGDLVYYDSDKNPTTREVDIVSYFLKQKNKGLPKGFIKSIKEDEFNIFKNLIK